MEHYHYSDLLKAHKIFRKIEGRWSFYDAYMQNRKPNIWFKSSQVPLSEGLLLFGFVQSWDPNFKGELSKFMKTYEDIFEMIKELEGLTIVNVQFTSHIKNTIAVIFDRIATCTRGRRYESTDTSKILHCIHPELFVMWDDKIRKAIVGEGRDGRCYAFDFLPEMQRRAHLFLQTYIQEKGGNLESASTAISSMADNYTLAKLLDEYNYVKHTRKIDLK